MKLGLREAYCPGHFGNSYEAMWPGEMRDYLAELHYWGFNRFGDWLDPADTINPYTAATGWPAELARFMWSLPMELVDRKKAALRAAAGLGMATDVVVTPNHVFVDQQRPDLLAAKGPRMIGQLLCPSKPEARALIHANFETQFRDFADSGVQVDSFTAFAYDFGGCGCDRCRPWIVTWAELTREVHAIARRCFPGIEAWLCSWWWSEEEYRLFAEWAAGRAPGWAKAVVFHIPYGNDAMDRGAVPDGCQRVGFVHAGYGDVADNLDLYGRFGPPVAAHRLPATLDAIAGQGATGFQAYSEGVHDDVNKALLAGLASGKARTADEALREYAARYFGAAPGDAAAWARWLAGWGDRAAVDLPAARAAFELLAARATSGWRLAHLRSKIDLEELDRAIAAGGDWDADRFALVERFWAAQERLNRGVYGLGPVRYVVSLRTIMPAWYDSWRRARGTAGHATVSSQPFEP